MKQSLRNLVKLRSCMLGYLMKQEKRGTGKRVVCCCLVYGVDW